MWNNRGNLQIKKDLSSYLFRAVHLRSITRIKEENASKSRIEQIFILSHPEEGTQLADYDINELFARIKEAIRRLPESYRSAFVQHRFYGKTYKEIAEELNVSHKTIDYRIQQALRQLRNDLGEYLKILLIGAFITINFALGCTMLLY